MIRALTLILLCQLAGEAVTRGLSLPIPGPVLGMAMLCGIMMLWAPIAEAIAWPMESTLMIE